MSVETSTTDSTDSEESAESKAQQAFNAAVKLLPDRFDCRLYESISQEYLVAKISEGYDSGDMMCGSSQTRHIERAGFDYERCYLYGDNGVKLWFRFEGTEE